MKKKWCGKYGNTVAANEHEAKQGISVGVQEGILLSSPNNAASVHNVHQRMCTVNVHISEYSTQHIRHLVL